MDEQDKYVIGLEVYDSTYGSSNQPLVEKKKSLPKVLSPDEIEELEEFISEEYLTKNHIKKELLNEPCVVEPLAKPMLEKGSNFIKKLWNKSVFPEKIKDYKEEKALKKSIQKEARKEALNEMKDEYKKVYKEKEISKLSGKKDGKSFLQKLADGMQSSGSGFGNVPNKMLGKSSERSSSDSRSVKKKDIVEQILGHPKKKIKKGKKRKVVYRQTSRQPKNVQPIKKGQGPSNDDIRKLI